MPQQALLNRLIALALIPSVLLTSGCASQIQAKDQYGETDTAIAAKRVDSEARVTRKASGVSHVNRYWLGSSTMPVAVDRKLPPAFTSVVTLVFPDRMNLSTIAERITRVTGIPVRVAPDVLSKSSSASQTASPVAAAPGAPTLPPPPGSMASASATSPAGSMDMTLNYSGSLQGALDVIAARGGIYWNYSDGAILFYRFETRTFVLNAIPGTSELTAAVGSGGSATTGGSGGSGATSASGSQTSSQSAGMASKLSVWEGVENSLKAMLTGNGKYAISMATGSITITDTPDTVSRIEKLIKFENARLSRQVNIRVQVYSVVSNGSNDYGVDWKHIFASMTGDKRISFTSPTGLANTAAGLLGINIMRDDSSTDLMLKAIASVGKASLVSSASVTALNNQPVPVAVSNQTTYLARSSTTVTGTAGISQTSLEPGSVTTGFSLNLLPHVVENDTVLLQYALDISDLERLVTINSGNASIQAPEVSSRKFLQRTALRNGETLMLSGFERTTGRNDRTGLLNEIPLLGGSDSAATKKESIIVLITPTVVEGAN